MTEPNPVWQSVVRYVASALVAVVLISLLGVVLFQRLGEDEAIRDAKDQTRASARWAVEPALTDGVLRGEPVALARLDRVVRERVLEGSSVVRVKIWDRSGRVVYSDERRLIGARYPIAADELDEFQDDRIHAHVSDLDKPENRFERSFGKLLEVYVGLTTPTGRPLRYEEYYRSSFVDARARRIFREFAFISLAALILLALIQLPLAWQLAHRVRRGQRERLELLQRAVDASERERRRIAADLHDGVVQNLAGVSYSLSAAASSASPELSPTLTEAAAETRQALRELRSLLVEIYPPDLHREGLEAALEDLLAPCAARGLETRLAVDDGDLPPPVEGLFFRAAQEALRNVVKHAGAQRVEVEVARRNGRAILRVEDDGSGFEVDGRPKGDHFGLRVLRDLVREVGGDLEIDSTPGRGTIVCVEVNV
jgi:two-component system, NarL family, sensor kinase